MAQIVCPEHTASQSGIYRPEHGQDKEDEGSTTHDGSFIVPYDDACHSRYRINNRGLDIGGSMDILLKGVSMDINVSINIDVDVDIAEC